MSKKEDKELVDLINKYREALSKITSALTEEIYPLSVSKQWQWQVGNAISAIKLAQCILRDIPELNKVKKDVYSQKTKR